jgi:hypothetical protein
MRQELNRTVIILMIPAWYSICVWAEHIEDAETSFSTPRLSNGSCWTRLILH